MRGFALLAALMLALSVATATVLVVRTSSADDAPSGGTLAYEAEALL